MLDYLIDQAEDRDGGDLNFCSFYPDQDTTLIRMKYLYAQAQISVADLPNPKFHAMINRGLIGLYLADRKVKQQKELWIMAKKLLHCGGTLSRIAFTYYRFVNRHADQYQKWPALTIRATGRSPLPLIE
jgi:tetraprenyl-beta-curcumene synthase